MEIDINITLNDAYQVRTESLDGKDHLVVPVVMMVEGVHSGSMGPMLYPAKELSKFTQAWNGRPVTINHPMGENGKPISAGSPDVPITGRIFNAHMDGTKLKAEAWINMDTLSLLSPEALTFLTDQKPLQVSTGVFVDEESIEGDWNGEHYKGIARNYRPDHLALLPNDEGACNWDDGCGVRANKSNDKSNKSSMAKESMIPKELADKMIPDISWLAVNESGYREIGMGIQRKLNLLDNDFQYYFLEEVFDGHFVYRVANKETDASTYYKRSYQVDNEGVVTFADDSEQVRRNIVYDPITNEKIGLTRKKLSTHVKPKNSMEKVKPTPCRIDMLIKNERTKFVEEDREWLATLESEQLDKLEPPKEEKPPVVVEEEVVNTTLPVEPVEDAIKRIMKEQKDPEAVINTFFPGELGDQMKTGLKMYREKREKIIGEIVENSKFTKEELAKFDTDVLEKMHSSVVKEVSDYSLNSHQLKKSSAVPSKELVEMVAINVIPKKEDK